MIFVHLEQQTDERNPAYFHQYPGFVVQVCRQTIYLTFMSKSRLKANSSCYWPFSNLLPACFTWMQIFKIKPTRILSCQIVFRLQYNDLWCWIFSTTVIFLKHFHCRYGKGQMIFLEIVFWGTSEIFEYIRDFARCLLKQTVSLGDTVVSTYRSCMRSFNSGGSKGMGVFRTGHILSF